MHQIGAYGTAAVPGAVPVAAGVGRHAVTGSEPVPVGGHAPVGGSVAVGGSALDARTDAYGFSFWTTPRDQGNGAHAPGPTDQAAPATWPGQPGAWQGMADAGWQAAAAAAHPVPQGTTRAGLPKRVPQAQLVPGSVDEPTVPAPRRSPEGARGLLSSYQRGVQRGRQGEPR